MTRGSYRHASRKGEGQVVQGGGPVAEKTPPRPARPLKSEIRYMTFLTHSGVGKAPRRFGDLAKPER